MLNKTTYKKKFEKTLHLIPEHQRAMAQEYIEELSFMREIMDKLKKQIAEIGVTSSFKNGAQTNTRQSPEYKAYLDVTNRYNQYMKQLLALYPVGEQEISNDLQAFLKEGVV